MIQRLIPAGGVGLPIAVTQQRLQQSSFQPDGIGQRRALYAEPPAVGRMLRIALDAHSVGRLRIQRRDYPTAHAAVGTGSTGHATFSAGVWIISAEESSKVVTSDAQLPHPVAAPVHSLIAARSPCPWAMAWQ